MFTGIHVVVFSIMALVILVAITIMLHLFMGRARFRLVHSKPRVVILAACLGTILGLILNLMFAVIGFTEGEVGNWCYDTFRFDDGAGLIPLMAFVVPITVVTSVLTILLDRTWNKAQHLQCRGCGYDLTGNVSGVCPECGTALREAGDLR